MRQLKGIISKMDGARLGLLNYCADEPDRSLFYPEGHTPPIASEFAPAVGVGGYGVGDVFCDVDERLPWPRNVHPFAVGRAVAEDDRQRFGMRCITQARPANAVAVIEIVDLLAVRIIASGGEKEIDQKLVRWE